MVEPIRYRPSSSVTGIAMMSVSVRSVCAYIFLRNVAFHVSN